MADNEELVIKLPENIYKYIMSTQFYIPGSKRGSLLEEILKAIRTGTSLPEGHGDLIDRREFVKELSVVLYRPVQSQMWIIEQAPTIIKEDMVEGSGEE